MRVAVKGVFKFLWMLLRASGRSPFLAAVKVILEPVYIEPTREPKLDTATSKGMMKRPNFPRVTSPKGLEHDGEGINSFLVLKKQYYTYQCNCI